MQEDEIKEVQKALEEDLVLLEQLQALHEQNSSSSFKRDAATSLKTLDSSMKKNTAVIRKLRTLSEATVPGILSDLGKLNHSKYVSEAVSAILESPLKLKDVRAVVQVLGALNRYPDFGAILFDRLTDEMIADLGASTVSKKRVLCRLFFCCTQAGIFPAANVRYITLDKIFRSFTAEKLVPGSQASLHSLTLVNSFLKAGGPGLFPRVCTYKNEMRLRGLASNGDAVARSCVEEIEKINGMRLALWTLSESDEQKMRMKVQAYMEGALKALESWWKHVRQTKKSNDLAIQSRGDISDKRHQEYREMCEVLEAFQKAVATLAATLRVSLPEYVIEEEEVVEEKGSVHLVEPTRIFEDAEERELYMALPQLAEVVPSTLLGASGVETGDTRDAVEALKDDSEQSGEDVGHEEKDAVEDDLMDNNIDTRDGPVADATQPTTSNSLSSLISRLPECVTIEDCDAFAVQYCYVGGKKASSQKALALALSRPPHGAIQLLPYYSRIIASLSPFFPIMKEDILSKLHRQFFGLKNVLDISTDTLEPRLRNACYIAELVKFGVYPPGKAFLQLRSLFDDFSRQNIDTACCLVENCGNYLYKRPDTSERMVNMMNIMVKLKDAKNLESRHEELISQARATMYGLQTTVQRKVRSQVHEFIRFEIYSVLVDRTVAEVAENILRIDWEKESWYVRKKILGAVRKGKESQLVPLALLVLELQGYDRQFGINVVDEVVEEIFCGMDHPDIIHYHRRLSMVRFLGAMADVRMPGVNNEMLVNIMRTLMSYSATMVSDASTGAGAMTAGNLGNSDVGEILEPMFRVRLIVALAVEAKSLYATRRRKGQKSRPSSKENIVVTKQKRALLDLVMPQLEEFVMRHNMDGPSSVSSIASHGVAALIQGMYQSCKLGKRVTFGSHEEAVENLAMSVKHAWSRYGSEGKGGYGSQPYDGEDIDDVDADDEEYADDIDDVEVDVNDLDEQNLDETRDEGAYSDDDLGGIDRADGPSEEELLFERELAMAMGGPIANHGAGAVAPSNGGTKVLAAPLGVAHAGAKDGQDGDDRPNRLAFKVITKRGGRDDKSKRTVHIPVSSSLVERVAKKKQAEAEEKAALKRMVLASSNL